jgi:flagellar biosynthesis protein FlhG
MSEALPAAAARPRRQIWSIGGGKGGIGKSLLTASLGWQLARAGKRVVLADADLAAPTSTCLGLSSPERTLGTPSGGAPSGSGRRGRDGLGLRLISWASDFLGAANIKYPQKVRVLNRIRSLDVDVVLLDLGAGTSFNILDFFLISDVALLMVVPEPTSIENAYRFIKSALYRRLRAAAATESVREIVESALDQKNPHGIKTPLDLLAAVEREDATAVEPLRREMTAFHPRFVVNQGEDADVPVGYQLVTACARHLGVRSTYAGTSLRRHGLDVSGMAGFAAEAPGQGRPGHRQDSARAGARRESLVW